MMIEVASDLLIEVHRLLAGDEAKVNLGVRLMGHDRFDTLSGVSPRFECDGLKIGNRGGNP